jgi:hypothetical protein
MRKENEEILSVTISVKLHIFMPLINLVLGFTIIQTHFTSYSTDIMRVNSQTKVNK